MSSVGCTSRDHRAGQLAAARLRGRTRAGWGGGDFVLRLACLVPVRVIIPLADKSLRSVIAVLDRNFRLAGAAPTYGLTDNEKTVTDRHIAGIAVRKRTAVDVSRYNGVSLVTCVPADPETKGGSEAALRVAKADLVPTEYNLLNNFGCFAELEAACEALCGELNGRPHSVTPRRPAEMLENRTGASARHP